MIGGTSFAKSQFNLAVQGERQPGSSFKPFVLAAALAHGISPSTQYVSKPQVISLGDKLWAVGNYENENLGQIDLETATIYSDNTVYAQLTSQLGPKAVVTMAHRLGIQSPLDGFLAIGLGVEAVDPLEMARAFSTFANDGARVDGSLLGNLPRAVLAVRDGKRLDSNEPVDRQILDVNQTAILNDLLQEVVEQGTGRRAQLPDRPVAGKTGTTENYGDAWFVGYTPQLAVAVWVGHPDRLQPMLTEFNGDAVAGGTYPALIWRTFMRSALEVLGEPPESFTAPSYGYEAPVRITFRDGRWMRDNGRCKDTETFIFYAGFEPDETADCKPNEVEVPNVIGAKVADAQARLADQPLQWDVLVRPAKPGEQPGVVLEQEPEAGTLGPFDTVRLIVAKAQYGTVPSLVGLTLEEARLKLADRELSGQVSALVDGNPGVVVSQQPEAGLAAAQHMTVNLIVGR
jgi:membrane peptidoglycan carboxypeptidase